MSEKRYLILGASSDIGVALIKELLCKGQQDVIICAQYHSDMQNLVELQSQEKSLHLLKADFSKPQEMPHFVNGAHAVLGIPTHIVHLPAEKFKYMRFKQFDWAVFARGLEIQVHSLVEVLKDFLPQMGKGVSRDKVVVMLTAYTIGIPPKFMSDYIMIKYALLGLVKSLASEYAGKNISINGLSPSMIETKFLSDIDPRMIEIVSGGSVGGKNAQVKDIIPVIEFLLSEASDYLNGINLNASNGNTL